MPASKHFSALLMRTKQQKLEIVDNCNEHNNNRKSTQQILSHINLLHFFFFELQSISLLNYISK